MNWKRAGILAAAMGLICGLLLSAPTQAQYDCETLAGYSTLFQNEIVWFRNNCVDEPEEDEPEEEEPYRPPDVTCPHLPPIVVVIGFIENTQCQMVDEGGIGRMEVIKRGVLAAVDVWNNMPEEVEVCFYDHGWLVFLDADYAPRMVMELEHTHPDDMTCGVIDRAGTVVLVDTAPPPVAATQPTTGTTLPIFEAIPLSDCQIKLVDTLFLRAEPAGEIIGLVWMNTEVPAFEINGYWYKIEFEGKTGYISRYHRKVLRGGCG